MSRNTFTRQSNNSRQSDNSKQQNKWVSPAIAVMAYLADFKEIDGRDGNSYMVCDLNGIENTSKGNIYHRYGCFVHGEETKKLLWDLDQDLNEERKILMGVLIRGMKPNIFQYEKGKRKGQDDVSYQSNLMFINWIRVDDEEIYRADPNRDDENQHLTIPEYQEYRKNDDSGGDRNGGRNRGRDRNDNDDEQEEDNSSRRGRSSSRSSESSGSSRSSSGNSRRSSSR